MKLSFGFGSLDKEPVILLCTVDGNWVRAVVAGETDWIEIDPAEALASDDAGPLMERDAWLSLFRRRLARVGGMSAAAKKLGLDEGTLS